MKQLVKYDDSMVLIQSKHQTYHLFGENSNQIKF